MYRLKDRQPKIGEYILAKLIDEESEYCVCRVEEDYYSKIIFVEAIEGTTFWYEDGIEGWIPVGEIKI